MASTNRKYFCLLNLLGLIQLAYFYKGKCDDHSSRNLAKIPTDSLKNVICVRLQRNNIEIVNSGSFLMLSKCHTLDLSFNVINNIQRSAFKGLKPRLNVLYLQGNKLTSLRADMWIGI